MSGMNIYEKVIYFDSKRWKNKILEFGEIWIRLAKRTGTNIYEKVTYFDQKPWKLQDRVLLPHISNHIII